MNHVSPSVLRKISDLGIDLIFEDISCSGYYFPEYRSIIINKMLLDSPDVNFAIMHELGHLLENHANDIILYNGTFTNRSKMEHAADFKAINLLIEIYLNDNDLEKEQLNVLRFMEQYGIKSSLYDCVTEQLTMQACK